MTATSLSPALLLSVSPLVSTERGVGFWDGVRNELRLAIGGVLVNPRIRRMRPATDLEVELFYSIRHEHRVRMCAYYNGRGRKWSGD